MKTRSGSGTAAGAAACLLAVAGLAATDDATAATSRSRFITATAVCESPLPQYDATLRKRPLGITNEATTPVFISCSLPADYVGDQVNGLLDFNFASLGVGGTVNCSLVAGSRLFGVTAIPKSVTVSAEGYSAIRWANIDKRHYFGSYNVTCNLPKDVELNTILYQENDTGDGL